MARYTTPTALDIMCLSLQSPNVEICMVINGTLAYVVATWRCSECGGKFNVKNPTQQEFWSLQIFCYMDETVNHNTYAARHYRRKDTPCLRRAHSAEISTSCTCSFRTIPRPFLLRHDEDRVGNMVMPSNYTQVSYLRSEPYARASIQFRILKLEPQMT